MHREEFASGRQGGPRELVLQVKGLDRYLPNRGTQTRNRAALRWQRRIWNPGLDRGTNRETGDASLRLPSIIAGGGGRSEEMGPSTSAVAKFLAWSAVFCFLCVGPPRPEGKKLFPRWDPVVGTRSLAPWTSFRSGLVRSCRPQSQPGLDCTSRGPPPTKTHLDDPLFPSEAAL